ncbi:MAG: 30S ribosomal protein S27ae [Candidatus Diapherotrites archaeon]|nr:30S ribosomal protein S27ae [Candidatus Diapherotrites archaeon]
MNKNKKNSKKHLKSKFYECGGAGVSRNRFYCSKCGPGVFLAEHKDRLTCGYCGYTKWK